MLQSIIKPVCFIDDFKHTQRVFQDFFMAVSWILQWCFQNNSMGFQGCVGGVSVILLECFKSIPRNDCPLHVHRQSNHPVGILKNIPLSVNKRLSTISASEDVFKANCQSGCIKEKWV